MPRKHDTAKAGQGTSPSSRSPWLEAAVLRRRARDLLEAPAPARPHGARVSDRRMILIGALVIILTMTMGLYLAVSGLYMVGEALFGTVLWLNAASDALYALLLLLLVLPLWGAVFRIAARMAADGLGTPAVLAEPSGAADAPTVADIFYPFSSPVAYGRTLLVAGEALLWLIAILVLPVLLFRVSALPLMHLARSSPVLYGITSVARPAVCLLIGAGMLLLSGCRAGFGYYVFTCPHMSVRDVARYMRSARRTARRRSCRPLLTGLCLRLSFVGWSALSLVGIGLPFILHVGPWGLLTGAVYARSLSPDSRSPSVSSSASYYRLENPT